MSSCTFDKQSSFWYGRIGHLPVAQPLTELQIIHANRHKNKIKNDSAKIIRVVHFCWMLFHILFLVCQSLDQSAYILKFILICISCLLPLALIGFLWLLRYQFSQLEI